ncbi:MAG: catalase, partial [Pseudolysinimonas sp.]
QVAFQTGNIVPGIDFTNDPLLQGRNFSYLDTQLKRLGSPNFTYLPVNAPKCPFANFQRDGQMTMNVPTGRANYEPNSWGAAGGPREDPAVGYTSYPVEESGGKRRVRAASFADHYSQARMFFNSQTGTEQQHIINALVFELSKVERVDIRERTVAGLRNIDEQLAALVADGLGMLEMPEAASVASSIIDVPASAALSIAANGPATFAGRKIGVLVTDGSESAVLAAIQAAAAAEGALVEIVAPKIGGVVLDDGTRRVAKQKIDGGPSVLYDAVCVIPSVEGAAMLAIDTAAKDFVSDAFAHCKVIGHTSSALALLEAAGVAMSIDEGFVEVATAADADAFVTRCRQLRFWAREPRTNLAGSPMT